jgi:hypothetical protein
MMIIIIIIIIIIKLPFCSTTNYVNGKLFFILDKSLSFNISMYPPSHPTTHQPTKPSIHPPVHPFIHSSIHPASYMATHKEIIEPVKEAKTRLNKT